MALMLEENTGQLIRKGSPTLLSVVLHPRVYLSVSRIARARMPAPTFGALVGKVGHTGGAARLAAVEAVPMELSLPSARARAWENLKERLAADATGLQLVGWFYADPGIGVFPPQVDAVEIHRSLAPDAQVLLLANPSTETGGFYVLQHGRFESLEGYYEAVTSPRPVSTIPWTGAIPGGSEWLQRPHAEPAAGIANPPDYEQEKTRTAVSPESEREQRQPEQAAPSPAYADNVPGRTAHAGRVDPWGLDDTTADQPLQDAPPAPVPTRVKRALDEAQAVIFALQQADHAAGEEAEPQETAAASAEPEPEPVLMAEPESPAPAESVAEPVAGDAEVAAPEAPIAEPTRMEEAPAVVPAVPAPETQAASTAPLNGPAAPQTDRLGFGPTRLLPVDTTPPGGQALPAAVHQPVERLSTVLIALGLIGVLGVIVVTILLATGILRGQNGSNGSVGNTPTPVLSAAERTATAQAIGGLAGNNTPTAVPAIDTSTPIPTATSTSTPADTSTPTPELTATLAATSTPPPTETATSVPPTLAPTLTPVPPTATPVPPTPTARPRPPTPTKPAFFYYTVRSGDSLSSIAARFGTTVQALQAANRLPSTFIYAGQVLVIPLR